MKVLHAYNLHRSGGGADNAVVDTIEMLTKDGIETEIFCRDSNDIMDNVLGKIKTFFLSIYPFKVIREFKCLLSNFKPDIVHVHELYPLISPWILPICKKYNIPVIMTCYDYRLTCPIATHYQQRKICIECLSFGEHRAVFNNCRNNIFESINYAFRNFLARKLCLYIKYVDRFIVLNEFSRGWLSEKLNIDDNKIDIIGCVVSTKDIQVIPSKGSYIAYAGRFVEEKGVEVLVEAMQYVNTNLKLIGYEKQLPDYNKQNIQVVKTSSREELDDLYRNAKILIVPSLWFETFGIVAAEAMAHGVPVIASDIGALKYTVQNGKSGLLFKMGNSRDLADKINALLDDELMLNNMGDNAYNYSKENFNRDIIMKRLITSYKKALTNE